MSLSRRLLPLGLVFLTVGIATAVVGPFLGLFLSAAVRASPIQVTFFLVTASLSGMAVSWAIGRISDRRVATGNLSLEHGLHRLERGVHRLVERGPRAGLPVTRKSAAKGVPGPAGGGGAGGAA